MASVRQSIMAAVKTRMQGISIDHGYQTDIGLKVTEWKGFDPDDKDLDCIEIRDISARVTDPDEEDDNAESWHYKDLNVQLFVMFAGSTAAADLRKMIADVLKAVGTDVTWGGNAINTVLTGDETLIEQEGKKIGVSLVTIVINYKTVKWQD